MALPNTSFVAEQLRKNSMEQPEQIDTGLEWVIKLAPLNVLYWLRNYLEKQQKIEDDFQKMRQNKIERSVWEKSKSEFQEAFHINEISQVLAEKEKMPADEQWKISVKFAELNLMPENIEAIKIIKEYRLGALSNKLRKLIQSAINVKIDADMDKEFIDEETGRLKGKTISVKGTGLDTSREDKYEPGHGDDFLTDMARVEKGRKPDDLFGETEDEDYEKFLTQNDRGRFVPIEDVDESALVENEGATFTDEYYTQLKKEREKAEKKRKKGNDDFNRQRASALKRQEKIEQARSQEEQDFLAKRTKFWPAITEKHNGLSLNLLKHLFQEKIIYNYTLEMVRDYLITLLLGNNDVANQFQLSGNKKKVKSEEISQREIAKPPYFIRKFNLENITVAHAELLKDELQKIISSMEYLKEKRRRQ